MSNEIKLTGFNFTKISAERNPSYTGKIETKSNVVIESMDKLKSSSKRDILRVDFSVNINYGDLGKVDLKGNLFLAAEPKTIKETINAWTEKTKTTDLQMTIVNIILQKTSIKAIQIEEEIGLPIHLQNLFPRVKNSESK